MKTVLPPLAAFLCVLSTAPADGLICDVIRIDSPNARAALRGPDFPSELSTAVAVGILTQPNCNDLLRKLDKQAKAIKAEEAGFALSTAKNVDPSDSNSITLTFTFRGSSSVVSLFEHQSLVVAAPSKQAPDGYFIYLFRLE